MFFELGYEPLFDLLLCGLSSVAKQAPMAAVNWHLPK